MKEHRFGIAAILILAIVSIGTAFIPDDNPDPVEKNLSGFTLHITYVAPKPNMDYLNECKENKIKAKSVIDNNFALKDQIDSMEIPTCELVMESLGNYYITGYTSWELNGSVQTASGAICHKADSIEDSLNNPTTCAIDPALHDFGDVFFLESFGYFIAEDTGSAILGKHLDLYYGLTYEDNQEALTITGYYEVFSVEYEYGTAKAGDYDIRPLVWEMQNETN